MNVSIVTPTNTTVIKNNFYTFIIKQNTTGLFGIGLILFIFVFFNIKDGFKELSPRLLVDFILMTIFLIFAIRSMLYLRYLNSRELKIDLINGKISLGLTEFPIKDKTIYYKPNGKTQFFKYGVGSPKANFYELDLGVESNSVDINLDSYAFNQIQEFIQKNSDYKLEVNTNFGFPKIL